MSRRNPTHFPTRHLVIAVSMARGRVRCWSGSVGELARAIQPDIASILECGFYGTHMFGAKHADQKSMETWSELAARFRKLDPRGSFFRQEDMVGAVKTLVDSQQHLTQFAEDAAAKMCLSMPELLAVMALKLRAMCAHDRARLTTRVKAERVEPLASKRPRLHPFKAFRPAEPEPQEQNSEGGDDEDEEEDADNQEQPLPVCRSYTPNKNTAVCLMTSGEEIPADFYQEGEDGMVVAVWNDPGGNWELSLDVPNSRLNSDGTITQKVVKKKPSAPSAQTEGEEVAGAGVGNVIIKTAITKRGKKCCLFLATTGPDKVQLLEASDITK